jgi:dihydrofolate synthase/folylpolyglutamate synthase
MGRWQILGQGPLIIADTGHNYEGLKFATRQLNSIQYNKLFIVFGMVKDKDPNKALSVLPKSAHYLFTKAAIPRALDENSLRNIASTFDLQGDAFATVTDAVQHAKSLAQPNDCIYIGGSTFIVAEALQCFK